MQRYGFAFLVLSLASTACGGDDDSGPKGQQGTVNEDVAKSSTRATIQAVTTVTTNDDGQSAAGQLMAAAQQAQGIVTPAIPGASGGTNAGTCDCDEATKTCTFQDCSDDAGNSSMSGTISWGGGKVKCDLDFVVKQVYDITLTTKCDITATANSIDGTLQSTGALSGISIPGASAGTPSGAYSWSVDSVFDGVTYAGGAPTGGSVAVNATYEIVGQKYVGSATVEFP